jgi:hypothetical protein
MLVLTGVWEWELELGLGLVSRVMAMAIIIGIWSVLHARFLALLSSPLILGLDHLIQMLIPTQVSGPSVPFFHAPAPSARNRIDNTVSQPRP